MTALRGFAGMALFCLVAWLLSSDRRRFPLKTVVGGLGLQWALALIVLKTDTGRAFFDGLAQIVMTILRGADAGARFVFGPLAGNDPMVQWSAVAGIKIMSTIIVVATLSAIGYHYGILQALVRVMAWVMSRVLGTSGAESLSGAANVFFGQTEAPLLVRPYLAGMTRSELMAVMSGGFATVAAGVMAVYVDMIGGGDAQRALATARHLMTASLMSAPAAFVMAKIMVPESQTPATLGRGQVRMERQTKNLLDAATSGASEGMRLAINVLAMLIAFIAVIAVIDAVLAWLGRLGFVAPLLSAMGLKELNLDGLLGLAFSPIAWLNGVAWQDCRSFGGLLGKAMATNEMVAYGQLAELARGQAMSPRSVTIALYSMCGFANFSSIGIQIGGIGSLAPERRTDLIRLGPRAMLAGAMACWMTGSIAAVLVK